VRLSTSFTKKVPAEEDYSSVGVGATIEIDVPDETARDTETLRSYLAELYSEAKQAVEQQLASVPRRNGNNQPAAQASGLFNRPNNPPEQRGNSQGVATPKQISFLVSLGARNKLTFADLQRIAQERFAAEDLYRLSKSQASELIDSLKPESSRR
jgi:hypothetical protein